MGLIDKFRCSICDSVGNWKNVDEFRFKKIGMYMCNGCGFVTYPDLCSQAQDIKKFYKESYRSAPTIANIDAGERKLHYHAEFLAPLFKEWKEKELKQPDILEIGAAFGMALNWFKQAYPGSRVEGTELTTEHVANAYHMFGLRLRDEPDWTKKYDLIMSYRVHEHIPNVDVELKKHVALLKDGGHFYISVPVWFGELNDPGREGLDLEFYYDSNHVNVWSRSLFEELLRKCGLKVIRNNHTMYGSTYLCVYSADLSKTPMRYDDSNVRVDELDRIFRAAKAQIEHRFNDAIDIWPNFPQAHTNNYEVNRNKAHQGGFDEIREKHIKRALLSCPNSPAIRNFAADLCSRYEQYIEAIGYLKEALDMKPNDPKALMELMKVYAEMAMRQQNEADRIKLWTEARDVARHIMMVSGQLRREAQTWAMQYNAKIPIPPEKTEDNGPIAA